MCRNLRVVLRRTVCLAVFLFLAAAAHGTPQEIAMSLAQDGWTEAEPGLWTRETADGRLQTQAFGADGLTAMVGRLESRLKTFEALYREHPDHQLEQILEKHLMLIDRLERQALELASGAAGKDTDSGPAPWCFVDWEAGLDFTCESQGAHAEATYNGSSAEDCFGDCDVVSFAYVRRTDCDGVTNSDLDGICYQNGINVSCTSSASLTGPTDGTDCFSYADAYISCDSGFYREEIRRSDTCCCVICK